MKLYRLQHREDNKGPYSTKDSTVWMFILSDLGGQQPSPCSEGIDFDKNELFLFRSLKTLHNWFSHSGINFLLSKGFDLLEYTVPERYVRHKLTESGQCTVPRDILELSTERVLNLPVVQ